jgi:hypothetical protein
VGAPIISGIEIYALVPNDLSTMPEQGIWCWVFGILNGKLVWFLFIEN